MQQLTIEQRARRQASRINNRARRELPLFAGTPAIDQFLTTADAQLPELVKKEQAGREYIERLNDLDVVFAERAAEFRQQLESILPPDDMAAADAYLQRMAANWPAFRTPVYQSDYWRGLLRKAVSA